MKREDVFSDRQGVFGQVQVMTNFFNRYRDTVCILLCYFDADPAA